MKFNLQDFSFMFKLGLNNFLAHESTRVVLYCNTHKINVMCRYYTEDIKRESAILFTRPLDIRAAV